MMQLRKPYIPILSMKTPSKYATFSDQELLSLLREGDTEAYASLYNRYFEVVYVQTFAKVGNDAETKDIVHEIFLRIWERRGQLLDIKNLKAFLLTATRNYILDLIARDKVADKYYNSFLASYNLPQETDFIIREKEIQGLIDEAIEALPSKMREVFELSRKEYLSHKEIAEKLNISEKTVKTQINNALKVLKKKLHPFLHFFIF